MPTEIEVNNCIISNRDKASPVMSIVLFCKYDLPVVEYIIKAVADPEGVRGFSRTPLCNKSIPFSWRIFRKTWKNINNQAKLTNQSPTLYKFEPLIKKSWILGNSSVTYAWKKYFIFLSTRKIEESHYRHISHVRFMQQRYHKEHCR